jgi:hypothetical protein
MKYIATLTCLLLAAFATPSFAHDHNDCAEKAGKLPTAERAAFTKKCMDEFASPTHVTAMKKHDKEQHCMTNAEGMKLQGKEKEEYLEHCGKENDMDGKENPHPHHHIAK